MKKVSNNRLWYGLGGGASVLAATFAATMFLGEESYNGPLVCDIGEIAANQQQISINYKDKAAVDDDNRLPSVLFSLQHCNADVQNRILLRSWGPLQIAYAGKENIAIEVLKTLPAAQQAEILRDEHTIQNESGKDDIHRTLTLLVQDRDDAAQLVTILQALPPADQARAFSGGAVNKLSENAQATAVLRMMEAMGDDDLQLMAEFKDKILKTLSFYGWAPEAEKLRARMGARQSPPPPAP